ncbi:putative protein phosphotase [Leishmania major strain Friedlin]|uniref:Serine/threonine specific protein phosphatases domain-containing protein n=1 Tax=Leishmania major TaxID=5664 RepID=Q4QAV4_LEIMA|nr:putative protein phosphotase [Leishmania major strain Friedlin]CAG9574493.1 protein_phosphatase [Leishmania major strain Friedlin]CAJ04065.1 putative protein phosphotase [Leishmania major strain Friedlin]|eukprot:XP_001683544.1 putative protein phosphotase [Leishmania major strain Friedlin]
MHASWVSAARLFVSPHTDTVQLTLLQPGVRTYVDGQRLLRIGSPVEVLATQRISFGADPTSYVVTPAPHSLVPGTHAACPPPPLAVPAYPAAVTREGQTSSLFTSPSSCVSPRLGCSLPPLCVDEEGERDTATAVSTSPEALTAVVAPANMESRQSGTPREAVSGSPLLAAPRASKMRGCCLTHASRSIAVTTTSTAENASAVRRTTEKCAISAPATERTSTDLLVECTATVARCSADVVSTTTGAALPPAYSKEERLGAAACSPSQGLTGEHAHSLASLCNETAELARRGIFKGESRARAHLHNRPCWTLGPVTSVRSPDWEVLRAMQGDTTPPGPKGIYQLSCGSVGFDEAMTHLRRGRVGPLAPSAGEVRQRPQPLRPRLQRAGAARHCGARHSSRGLSLEFTERTSVDVEGEGTATATHATPLSRDEAVTEPSSVLSSDLTATQSARQRPYMREKLHLFPRVPVNPFIVEAFGQTHRYRPLAHLSDTPQADSSCSSAKSEDGSAPVDVFDRFAGVPWRHPIVADEMVTPRTAALLGDILRRRPDSTPASEDATFLHCALRRSYDADKDRFSYVDSPAFVQLIYTRFSSLLTAIKARMQVSRPVLRLSSPLLCGGDLLGSFADLMVLLGSVAHFAHWSTMHTPLLLLGNYVDVGWHSVEVCMLLCCWAYLQPSKVHLLRGPHEDPTVNGNCRLLGKRCLRYKCRQRFGSRRGIALWAQLNDVFTLLPVAAVIDERVFATHGGVPLLRASTAPGGEEEKGAAVRRQRGGKAPVHCLYSGTSGSPTPTSSDANTTVSSSCRLSAGVCAGERRTACAHERGGDDARESVLFAALCPFDMRYHRSQTPVMEKPRDAITADDAEAQNDITAIGLLSLAPLSGYQVDESDGCPRASTECAAARGAVVSATALPSSPTPPSSTVPPPRQGMTGVAPQGRCDMSAAVALPAATTQAPTPALVSPFSRAADTRFIAAAAPSHSEALTRTTPACSTPSAATGAVRCVAHGGRVATQRSTDACREASSSLERSRREDFLPFETLRQGCAPPTAAAAESSPAPCSAASACVTGSEVRSSQECEADTWLPSTHTSVDEGAPSEDDFANLLAAMHTGEYAFRTLQCSTPLESQDVTRRLRLVRELLWNRPREATAKLLMPEEELDSDGGNAAAVPWWRPYRVEGCCCCCPAGRAHRCCHTFGSGALIRFFLRFRYSMLIRGAPEDPSELCGAELSEEGRLLTLNTCSRRCKTVLQAAACVVESQTLRLATWGSQELADSLGQLSLSSLPGVRETEAARADFEQFVCNTLHTRLRDHHIVGPADQWSVLSAYKTYIQRRAAASASSRRL